ncbi:MAG: efflux RND transporter periplasmic adaptor subunit [Candidatus Delongbacteria bacterium]|nr:efflux RND transporter periplasmic adaptor subunit [Candidatus Delongbacteria bacterium]
MKKVIIVVVAIIAVLAVWRIATFKKAAEAKEKSAVVKVVRPVVAGIDEKIYYQGKITGGLQAGLMAPSASKVERILVNVGEVVRKGQRLVQLDNESILQQLKTVEAQLQSAKLSYEAAESEFARQKELYQAKTISQKAFDQAQSQYEASKAAFTSAGESVKTNRKKYEDSFLSSPFDGILISNNAEVGVQVSLSQPVVVVADTSSWKVRVDLASVHMDKVRKGTRALIITPNSDTLQGVVSWSDLGIDPSQGKGNTEVTFSNSGVTIIPGSWCKVYFVVQHKENAMLVPADAVLEETEISSRQDGQGSLTGFKRLYKVFVVENSVAIQKMVIPGIKDDRWIEILSGLSQTDQVVVEGQRRLLMNESVTIAQ